MTKVDDNWFNPRSLYEHGIPGSLTCALSLFPVIADKIRECIALTGAKRALEIGPGEVTLLDPVPERGRVYFDISEAELSGLKGGRVVGDAITLPFKSHTFDVVVMADVLPHLPPRRRSVALAEAARVAPRLLVFNQEFGNPNVKDSYMSATEIVFVLKCLGYNVGKIHYDSTNTVNGKKSSVPLDIICASKS